MPFYSNNNSIKNSKKQSVRFKIGLTLICIFSVLLINVMFNLIKFVNSFFLGTFGLFTYVIFISLILFGIMLMKNKKISLEPIDITVLSLWLVVLLIIIQVATSGNLFNSGYGNYISACYYNKLTCGGAILAIVTYPFYLIFSHFVAIYVILSILLLILTSVIVVRLVKYKDTFVEMLKGNSVKTSKTKAIKTEAKSTEEVENKSDLLIKNETEADLADDIFISDNEVAKASTTNNVVIKTNDKDYEKARNILGLSNGRVTNEDNEITMLAPQFSNKGNVSDKKYAQYNNKPKKYIHEIIEEKPKNEKTLTERDKENLKYLHEITGGYYGSNTAKEESNLTEQLKTEPENYDVMNDLFDNTITKSNYKTSYNPNTNSQINNNSFGTNTELNNFNDSQFETEVVDFKKPNFSPTYKQVVIKECEPREAPSQNKKLYKKPSRYVKPTIDLLKSYDPGQGVNTEDFTEKARMLEETLASFNAPAKVVTITKGPAFTRFELQMQQGVPVKKVNSHIEDIAMILKARGDVRTEIPIPGKNAFGVELPNESIETVGLKDVLESYNFQGSKSVLTFGLGKDITGEAKVARIEKMPHLLIAGSTGSGKSVCLNALLISLLYKASPDDLRLILIDPKRVEFTLYNGLPHMLLPNVITDIEKALKALEWLINEMERRFNFFSEARVRNLEEYNNSEEVIKQIKPKFPNIVFVIDELGDLMLQNKKDVEDKIIRLTQKCRAAGIYLVLATQRPSVDVITGTIKANLPSRIAFAVSSFPDSKTILDQGGAEKLLGKGDMLYFPQDVADPIRIQGAFVSNDEVEAVVEFIKEHNDPDFDSDIEDEMFNKKQNGFNVESGTTQEFDVLMKDALRLVIKTQGVSVSKIQRAFGLGFPRAGKIVDQMEAAGFISAPDNKKIRTIYITQQEFEERFGEDL